ncbi:MAG: hypothetical protein HY553_07620 [Elusimicrobia bacterium]|nr:hypothetical protein [Elusimicrobiota bacterium]
MKRSGLLLALSVGLAGVGLERASGQNLPPPPGHSDHRGGTHGGPGGRGERGREAALRACARATFSDDKRECMAAVNQGGFFDADAAEACGRMSFGSNIPGCIRAISNKVYSPTEIQLCLGASFDDDKVECFQTGGRTWANRPRWERRPDLDSYILEQLRGVRRSLQRGDVIRAAADLADLIDFIEQGSR